MKDLLMKRLSVMAAALVFATALSAQSRDEIVKVYNAGVKAIQTNIDSAIMAFENVVTMSEKAGESANDLKEKAIQVLPGLHLRSATTKFTEKKPAAEIVRASKRAIASAEKHGNTQVKENAGKVLSQAYSRMATEYFSKKDYDNALATFDSVLAVIPDNLPAIYNKALIHRTKNNAEALGETVDLYLSKADPNDKGAKQASQMALEYFRAAGSQANQENNLDKALELLDKAAKYGEDKDLNYYYADVYNKKKDFDKGAEFAQKGLALETGNAEAKAKFYYQLAVAQSGKGQNAEACESFKNAMYGPFAEASKAQRTNLKCQ